jgi:hypothetical protein
VLCCVSLCVSDLPDECHTCSAPTCVNASLPRDTILDVDGRYQIVLAANTVFHAYSNPLKQTISLDGMLLM